MNDPRPTELAVQIAALRADLARATDSSKELRSISARAVCRARPSRPGAAEAFPVDALARALAAERRLECLIRLAAGIIPAQCDSTRASYRPPSAWRAFARELSRAKRHLQRARGDG